MYRRAFALFPAVLLIVSAAGQATTSFTGSFTIGNQPDIATFTSVYEGTGQVGTSGTAVVLFSTMQTLGDDQVSGVGRADLTYTELRFTRLDTILIRNDAIADLTPSSLTVTGRVANGTGVFAGISNPTDSGVVTTMTLTRVSASPLRYTMNLSGAALLNGQTLSLAMTNVNLPLASTAINDSGASNGPGSFVPFGKVQATVGVYPAGAKTFGTAKFIQVLGVWIISDADSIRFLLSSASQIPSVGAPFTIVGGSGQYNGASGSGTITSLGLSLSGLTTSVAGSVTPAGSGPVISSVGTSGFGGRVAQNAWIEIKGTNLVPANTAAGGKFWSDAPDFAQGKMPTQLGDISVTVNGKPAYVWWYCSKVTTPACDSDQINVLTPLDDATDQFVQVVVKNGSQTSAAYMVPKDSVTASSLLFDAKGHGVLTHANGSLLGPTSLYPGSSTPAKAGETVVLWLTGLGLPTTTLVQGASTQSGPMPLPLACTLEALPAPATVALVSPGLYQMNVTIPANAPAGDNDHLTCTYGNSVISLVLVAVQ